MVPVSLLMRESPARDRVSIVGLAMRSRNVSPARRSIRSRKRRAGASERPAAAFSVVSVFLRDLRVKPYRPIRPHGGCGQGRRPAPAPVPPSDVRPRSGRAVRKVSHGDHGGRRRPRRRGEARPARSAGSLAGVTRCARILAVASYCLVTVTIRACGCPPGDQISIGLPMRSRNVSPARRPIRSRKRRAGASERPAAAFSVVSVVLRDLRAKPCEPHGRTEA